MGGKWVKLGLQQAHLSPGQATSTKNADNFPLHFQAKLIWETAASSIENFKQQIWNFHFKILKANAKITPFEKALKLCPQIVLEIVYIFVYGHLSLWKEV